MNSDELQGGQGMQRRTAHHLQHNINLSNRKYSNQGSSSSLAKDEEEKKSSGAQHQNAQPKKQADDLDKATSMYNIKDYDMIKKQFAKTKSYTLSKLDHRGQEQTQKVQQKRGSLKHQDQPKTFISQLEHQKQTQIQDVANHFLSQPGLNLQLHEMSLQSNDDPFGLITSASEDSCKQQPSTPLKQNQVSQPKVRSLSKFRNKDVEQKQLKSAFNKDFGDIPRSISKQKVTFAEHLDQNLMLNVLPLQKKISNVHFDLPEDSKNDDQNKLQMVREPSPQSRRNGINQGVLQFCDEEELDEFKSIVVKDDQREDFFEALEGSPTYPFESFSPSSRKQQMALYKPNLVQEDPFDEPKFQEQICRSSFNKKRDDQQEQPYGFPKAAGSRNSLLEINEISEIQAAMLSSANEISGFTPQVFVNLQTPHHNQLQIIRQESNKQENMEQVNIDESFLSCID